MKRKLTHKKNKTKYRSTYKKSMKRKLTHKKNKTKHRSTHKKNKTKHRSIHKKSMKHHQMGGDKPFITNIGGINYFKESKMEKFLNPIYGYIMCENGLIKNMYHLNHTFPTIYDTKDYKDYEDYKIIKKMCKIIPGDIQPTNDIMELKPIDFGRYIAIKYINKDHKIITISGKGSITFNLPKLKEGVDTSILIECINKFNKYIKIDENHDELYFHFILYCFWWNCDNDDGIKEYYKGINEMFEFFKTNSEGNSINYSIIDTPQQIDNNTSQQIDTFEKIIFNILKKPFNIYNQEWAKNFCDKKSNKKSTYPDCGEVTARNLLNLICFDGEKFDIELLGENCLQQVKDYYKHFYNFNSQSNDKNLFKIDDDVELNARDAWSYIIITYAKQGINFLKKCNGDKINYEMNAGLSQDKKTGNFLQLIKNLLGINEWDDIKNDLITDIKDNK